MQLTFGLSMNVNIANIPVSPGKDEKTYTVCGGFEASADTTMANKP